MPFDFENSEWLKGQMCCSSDGPGQILCGYYDYKLAYGGDSVLEGKTYRILDQWRAVFEWQGDTSSYPPQYRIQHSLIREDSGKVYVKYLLHVLPDWQPSDEILLYDFTLDIGDTITLPCFVCNTDTTYNLIVESKDSVLTQLGYRKSITLIKDGLINLEELVGVNPSDRITWIQGVGSNKGLLYDFDLQTANLLSLVHCDVNFLCHKQDSQYVYGVGYCRMYATDVKEETPQLITIYPNPTDNSITVKLPIKFSSCTLQIIDLQGRVVKTETLSGNSQAITTDNLPGGVYQLIISSKDKLLGREKLVVVR